MTRLHSRVTRQTAAVLLNRSGLPVLLVVGVGLGLSVMQHVRRALGSDTEARDEDRPCGDGA